MRLFVASVAPIAYLYDAAATRPERRSHFIRAGAGEAGTNETGLVLRRYAESSVGTRQRTWTAAFLRPRKGVSLHI